MRSLLKAQPLCSKPVSGIFTGPDKYLTLQEITIREAIPPIAEDDSLFVYVKSGSGHLTVNGVVFDLAGQLLLAAELSCVLPGPCVGQRTGAAGAGV